jgi:hypothetical protein
MLNYWSTTNYKALGTWVGKISFSYSPAESLKGPLPSAVPAAAAPRSDFHIRKSLP